MKAAFLLVAALLLAASAAHAQSASPCPALPADRDVAWETLSGPGYTFCKAIRDSDGRQLLAVMITSEAPFQPRRRQRVQEAVIDGSRTWWYRGELSDTSGVEVRETLVELDREHVAHVSLRGRDENELLDAMALAEALRFDNVRVSLN